MQILAVMSLADIDILGHTYPVANSQETGMTGMTISSCVVRFRKSSEVADQADYLTRKPTKLVTM